MPDPTSKTEITAEIALLSRQQSDARDKRIYIGWSTAETAAYDARGGRITFLRRDLLK
jgi:hypothetical protein